MAPLVLPTSVRCIHSRMQVRRPVRVFCVTPEISGPPTGPSRPRPGGPPQPSGKLTRPSPGPPGQGPGGNYGGRSTYQGRGPGRGYQGPPGDNAGAGAGGPGGNQGRGNGDAPSRGGYSGPGGGRGQPGRGGYQGRGGPGVGRGGFQGRGGFIPRGGFQGGRGGPGRDQGGRAGGGRGRQNRNDHVVADHGLTINFNIESPEVRVIDGSKEPIGIMSLGEAIALAELTNDDVILVNAGAVPQLVRIVSVSKFRYEADKVKKEASKKQREKMQTLKELKLSPRTEEHDLMVRIRRAREHLSKGDKVKIVVQFKGREKYSMGPIAQDLVERLIAEVEEVSTVESLPKMAGNQMFATLVPKSTQT